MLTPQEVEIVQHQIDACTDQIKIFENSLIDKVENKSHKDSDYKEWIEDLKEKKAGLEAFLKDPNSTFNPKVLGVDSATFAALESKVTALESKVTALESKVTALESKLTVTTLGMAAPPVPPAPGT